MPVVNRTRTGPLLAALVLAALTWARPAWADAEAEFKRAQAAYDAGRFDEAAHIAEAAYVDKPLAKLVYLKAMATWKAGRVGEAWSVMQLVRPKDLAPTAQEQFVQDYENLEKAVKEAHASKQKADEATAAAQARRKVAHDARAERRKSARRLWWMGGGTAVVGAGVLYLGYLTAHAADDDLSQHADHRDAYKSSYALGQAEWWSGVGLIAIGGGLGLWGAVKAGSDDDDDDPVAAGSPWRAVHVSSVGPLALPGGGGLALSGGF